MTSIHHVSRSAGSMADQANTEKKTAIQIRILKFKIPPTANRDFNKQP